MEDGKSNPIFEGRRPDCFVFHPPPLLMHFPHDHALAVRLATPDSIFARQVFAQVGTGNTYRTQIGPLHNNKVFAIALTHTPDHLLRTIFISFTILPPYKGFHRFSLNTEVHGLIVDHFQQFIAPWKIKVWENTLQKTLIPDNSTATWDFVSKFQAHTYGNIPHTLSELEDQESEGFRDIILVNKATQIAVHKLTTSQILQTSNILKSLSSFVVVG